MVGTIKVDFAGTFTDVRRFIDDNKSKFRRTLTSGRGKHEKTVNGDHMLVASFNSGEECSKVEQAFEELGWLVCDQTRKVNGKK